MITAAKNNSIQQIRFFKVSKDIKSAQDMSAPLFESLSQAKVSPQMALALLREEVGLLLN
jgi:hypothetical protein